MNFEKWEYHKRNLPTEPADRTAFLQQLKTKFKNDIEANSAAGAWLAEYNQSSVEIFIDNYVDLKVNIVENSDWYIEKVEKIPELQYRRETEDTLNMILHKKLFNLQLRWRAELISVPEIRITQDFMYWEKDIRNCTFIEPVTEQELDLMRRYVLTDVFNEGDRERQYASWQEYDEIMGKDENGLFHNMPDWYEYYDSYMGTGTLLLLPDIRGQKELHYRSVHKPQSQNSTDPPPKFAPWLIYSLAQFNEMASRFDDPYFKALIAAKRNEEAFEDDLSGEEEDILYYIRKMEKIPDLPPVRGGLGWRKALLRCYRDYINNIIHRDLPLVCGEYLMYRSLGIHSSPMSEHNHELHTMLCKVVLDQILEGRELSGEPRDLNF